MSKTFHQELVELLDKHKMEELSGTPGWIVGEYLMGSLRAFQLTVSLMKRDDERRNALEVNATKPIKNQSNRVYVPGLGMLPEEILTPEQAETAKRYKQWQEEVKDQSPEDFKRNRLGGWPVDEKAYEKWKEKARFVPGCGFILESELTPEQTRSADDWEAFKAEKAAELPTMRPAVPPSNTKTINLFGKRPETLADILKEEER